MKLLDSSSKKYLIFNDQEISIYNCGPTVYNDIHIGNARPLIVIDVLHRLLLQYKINVKVIHNITDIDDKIIQKALDEQTTEQNISEKYYQNYLKILKQLNILPMVMPKVSDNINGIINYIDQLLKKNYAYTVDGSVYFDVNKIPQYGIVSGQKKEQLKSNERTNFKKHSPLDFALWKNTNIGLKWWAPWSYGRPGWHTECAFFINNLIGETVTIHAGGIDLKFPHHENENAQNIALTGKNIAKCFMHVGHVMIDDKKMSKSENNFILLKDLLNEYSGNDLRWFMYQSTYQNPLKYDKKLLNESTNSLLKVFQQINNAYIQLILINQKTKTLTQNPDDTFINYLSDDLNFPNAVSLIHKQAKGLTKLLRTKKYDELIKQLDIIQEEFKILGINYVNPLDDKQIFSLIKEWKQAIDNKEYVIADKYREQLISKKII